MVRSTIFGVLRGPYWVLENDAGSVSPVPSHTMYQIGEMLVLKCFINALVNE
jgi:hypothetical protein